MISADNFWAQFGHRTALAMVHGLTGWQQCWKLVFALTEMLGSLLETLQVAEMTVLRRWHLQQGQQQGNMSLCARPASVLGRRVNKCL